MEVEKSVRGRRKGSANKESGNEMYMEVGQSRRSVGKLGQGNIRKGRRTEKGIEKKKASPLLLF